MENTTIALVLTTTETEEEAKRIASTLVDERLTACAQVSGPITSFYWWNGQREEAEEWLIRMKTTWSRYPDLERRLKEIHPYSLPQIVALPAQRVLPEYKKWVEDEVSP